VSRILSALSLEPPPWSLETRAAGVFPVQVAPVPRFPQRSRRSRADLVFSHCAGQDFPGLAAHFIFFDRRFGCSNDPFFPLNRRARLVSARRPGLPSNLAYSHHAQFVVSSFFFCFYSRSRFFNATCGLRAMLLAPVFLILVHSFSRTAGWDELGAFVVFCTPRRRTRSESTQASGFPFRGGSPVVEEYFEIR